MLERVAVIGLGNMGLPIARNLLRAGFPLTVHNRTKAKAEPLAAEGAAWAESPAAAGARARIVVTMVSDDTALDGVVFGEHGLLVAGDRAPARRRTPPARRPVRRGARVRATGDGGAGEALGRRRRRRRRGGDVPAPAEGGQPRDLARGGRPEPGESREARGKLPAPGDARGARGGLRVRGEGRHKSLRGARDAERRALRVARLPGKRRAHMSRRVQPRRLSAGARTQRRAPGAARGRPAG